MEVQVFPEPTEDERRAIVAALGGDAEEPSAWAAAALADGEDDRDP